jgi:hypothetical protein
MSRLRVIALALVVARPVAFGGALTAQAAAQNPAPIRAISADGGYAVRFAAGSKSEGWYRVTYQGKLIREQGTPFKSAKALDLLAPPSKKAAGDVPALLLRYENDQTFAGGGLVSALGAKELPLAGLSKLGLRGTAQAASDIKLKHIEAAVGLETPPARVPGLAGRGVSNWIVVGVDAERREATDSGGNDVNLALATFRNFVGKAVGWRKSANVERTAAKIVHDLLELAPTREAALRLRAHLDSIQPPRPDLQQAILDAIPEAKTDSDWVAKVKEMGVGEADAITDQPTAALYAEWSGWVDLASTPSSGRFRSLFTASLDYWFLPSRDDVLLRLRYEMGYERASPDLKRNQILVSVGIRL